MPEQKARKLRELWKKSCFQKEKDIVFVSILCHRIHSMRQAMSYNLQISLDTKRKKKMLALRPRNWLCKIQSFNIEKNV